MVVLGDEPMFRIAGCAGLVATALAFVASKRLAPPRVRVAMLTTGALALATWRSV
jgi:hypothetical protein